MDLNIYYKNLKKKLINCPVCNNNSYKVLGNRDRYSMGVQTVICDKCSLIYLNPRPTEEEMANFYKNHYRNVYESIEIPTEEYIKKGPFIPRANFVLDVLRPYLSNSESFLDIGCAEGTLLKKVEIEFENIKTLGIEPSIGFGNYAKQQLKGEVFVGTYQEYLEDNEFSKYDVIATTHVLEHILKPKEYLNGIRAFMHDDSLLYIEVPNIANTKAMGIGNIHLGHVLYLDPITISLLLEECGFEIINIYTEDLPAKTPSMSVICKKGALKKVEFPSKKYINIKASVFKQKILGELNTKSIKSNNIFNLIKRFYSKIISISSK